MEPDKVWEKGREILLESKKESDKYWQREGKLGKKRKREKKRDWENGIILRGKQKD